MKYINYKQVSLILIGLLISVSVIMTAVGIVSSQEPVIQSNHQQYIKNLKVDTLEVNSLLVKEIATLNNLSTRKIKVFEDFNKEEPRIILGVMEGNAMIVLTDGQQLEGSKDVLILQNNTNSSLILIINEEGSLIDFLGGKKEE